MFDSRLIVGIVLGGEEVDAAESQASFELLLHLLEVDELPVVLICEVLLLLLLSELVY